MRTRTPYRRPTRAERAARVRELRAAIAALGRNRPPRPTLDELLAGCELTAAPSPTDDAGDRSAATIAHDIDRVNALLAEAADLDRRAARR